MRPIMLRLFWTGCLATTAPVAAQDAERPLSPAQMIEEERHYLGIARSVTGCRAASQDDPDTIVVCGRYKPDPRYEPPPPPAPPDAKTLALGAPPVGKGAGVGVTIRACFLQKCPKDLYFIDVKAIPEAAPGTDADRIGKGEMR